VVRRSWPWIRSSASPSGAPDVNDTVNRLIVRQGEAVNIGRHILADRDRFMAWYQDPEIAELLRHDLAPLSPGQARGYFDSIIMPATQRGLCWAIVRAEDGNLLGSTALVDLNDATGGALFRIVIGEKTAWGQGLGTETTRLVLAEAFERFNRRMVNLEVFAHNPRAQRAYEKAGFRQVGQHQEWVARSSRQIDVLEMRITRAEWQASHVPNPGHRRLPSID
jgi:RimJ/RimL family protein N-acetyltransferase